jgi:uncharacterized ferredoxin-like protein
MGAKVSIYVYGDIDEPTVKIGEKEFEVADLECECCGFITGEHKIEVSEALEEWWGSNSTRPCYVEVCSSASCH